MTFESTKIFNINVRTNKTEKFSQRKFFSKRLACFKVNLIFPFPTDEFGIDHSRKIILGANSLSFLNSEKSKVNFVRELKLKLYLFFLIEKVGSLMNTVLMSTNFGAFLSRTFWKFSDIQASHNILRQILSLSSIYFCQKRKLCFCAYLREDDFIVLNDFLIPCLEK